jgi:leucyl/phenylalanyl-tRNA--protein transferase
MPYFELSKGVSNFPPAHFADLDGLLAVGGEMSEDLLLAAYKNGIYYWHHPMKHIRWWSPDPRIVLYPKQLDPPESIRESGFTTTVNTDFEGLLRCCQKQYNKTEAMTPSWLSERMFRIFTGLFGKGFIHAQEVWKEDILVGGLFGVRLGNLFFGEYAVEKMPGAATYAILKAGGALDNEGVCLMDMQKETSRSEALEYDTLSRVAFVDLCKEATAPRNSKTKPL